MISFLVLAALATGGYAAFTLGYYGLDLTFRLGTYQRNVKLGALVPVLPTVKPRNRKKPKAAA